MIEGGLIDNDGTVYRPADLVQLKEGTQHSSHTPHACLLAVSIGGIEYSVED